VVVLDFIIIHLGLLFKPFMGMLLAQGIEFHAQKQHISFSERKSWCVCVCLAERAPLASSS